MTLAMGVTLEQWQKSFLELSAYASWISLTVAWTTAYL